MVEKLKELRLLKEISQQQLADVIGVSQQSVNKYENHSVEPDITTLKAIADFFNTSIDYLVGATDNPRRIETTQPWDLNGDEAEIISGYRVLNGKEKSSVREIIKNYNSYKTH